MTRELSIPHQDLQLSALLDTAADPQGLMVLAHGSGAGKDHDFLAGYAGAMAAGGVSVLRFNFPYMDAGKKFPDRAPAAVAAWNSVRDFAASQLADGLPLVAAGKSFGGRVASMAVAEGMAADALVFLGYPLHAPGKQEKLRDEHLYPLDTPMLFLEGTRDPFADVQLMTSVAARLNQHSTLQWFEGGNHSFKVARSGRTPAQDGAWLAPASLDFLASLRGQGLLRTA